MLNRNVAQSTLSQRWLGVLGWDMVERRGALPCSAGMVRPGVCPSSGVDTAGSLQLMLRPGGSCRVGLQAEGLGCLPAPSVSARLQSSMEDRLVTAFLNLKFWI